MGRRKIQIAPIQDDRNRNVTFGKRRNGLFKKAYELGVLCSVDVAVLVWGHNGKMFAFSSQGSLKGMIDRYHRAPPNDNDIIGPVHYGGDLSDLAALKAASGMDGLRDHVKHKSKRRRSDDDSDDDDDDDDGDDEGLDTLGSNSSHHHQMPPSQLSSSAPTHLPSHMPHDPSMYPNGGPHFAAELQRYGLPQPPPPHHVHPYYGAYPYPGYPHHMPNVNPALGNSMGFYGPSAAAMAAAAAATGNYNYGALPPHLVRAAAQQYAQETTGSASANSTPPSNQNGSAPPPPPPATSGYTPIRSPVPMDTSHHAPAGHQHQQQQHAESSSRYGRQPSSSSQQQQHPGSSPTGGHSRKPALHLDFGQSGGSTSNGMGDHATHAQSNGVDIQPQYGQANDRRDSYSDHNAMQASTSGNVPNNNNNNSLGVPGGIPFPDYALTSPSQLFPEIYRSMNAYAESQATRAMTFGAENTPGAEEDDGNDALRNIFRWPTLASTGSVSSNNNNNTNNSAVGNAAGPGSLGGSHPNSNSNTPNIPNSAQPRAPPQRQESTGSNFSAAGLLDGLSNARANGVPMGHNSVGAGGGEHDLRSSIKQEGGHEHDARMERSLS